MKSAADSKKKALQSVKEKKAVSSNAEKPAKAKGDKKTQAVPVKEIKVSKASGKEVKSSKATPPAAPAKKAEPVKTQKKVASSTKKESVKVTPKTAEKAVTVSEKATVKKETLKKSIASKPDLKVANKKNDAKTEKPIKKDAPVSKSAVEQGKHSKAVKAPEKVKADVKAKVPEKTKTDAKSKVPEKVKVAEKAKTPEKKVVSPAKTSKDNAAPKTVVKVQKKSPVKAEVIEIDEVEDIVTETVTVAVSSEKTSKNAKSSKKNAPVVETVVETKEEEIKASKKRIIVVQTAPVVAETPSVETEDEEDVQADIDITQLVAGDKDPMLDKKNAKAAAKNGTVTKNDTMKVYMHDIGQISLVTKEQEVDLAAKIHGHDNYAHDEARATLIKANLRLVVKIAHDFKGLGLPLLDLISEGNIGLMRAVEKFDPAKGAKFSSYAAWWIKQSMRRALANQSRTIRIPVQSAGKINKIKSVRMKLAEKLGREPTDAEIAEHLDYSERTVAGLRLADLRTFSLHDPIQQGEDGEFQDIIPDRGAQTPDRILSDVESVGRLMSLLSELEDREKMILKMRFGLDGKRPKTLEEVSQEIGRTRERVRQIQNQALTKLRALLADEAGFANE